MARTSKKSPNSARQRKQAAMPPSPLAQQSQQQLDNIRTALAHDQTELAVSLLATLQQHDPANPQALLLAGTLQMQHGKPKEALSSLLSASYQLPNHPEVYKRLARLHAQLGHDRAALSAMHQLVALRPSNAQGLFQLAAMYYEAGYPTQGSLWARRALLKRPFVVINAEREEKLRVLVLRNAAASQWRFDAQQFRYALVQGHRHLPGGLDAAHITRVELFVDTLENTPELLRKLPEVDVVLNIIEDTPANQAALSMASHVAERLNRPLIHSAELVDETQNTEQQAELAHARLCEKVGVAPWEFELPVPPAPGVGSDTPLTLHLIITGAVQGVGYRQWLADELSQREIAGWVRNLADGSAEAVIHGTLERLQPLCDAVPNGPENANVTGLNVTPWKGDIPEGVAILETL
ncbi:acylphosphatase [Halomonas sp. QHL1]|uniref:acylphosphatase n=1 Tax=Halomonas sp. QHL1 TaxID=1123773 RepID=UPI0009FB51F7|nr:acylphosphatase [Halomonas sp. QHL1]